jgi:hypothetical protein
MPKAAIGGRMSPQQSVMTGPSTAQTMTRTAPMRTSFFFNQHFAHTVTQPKNEEQNMEMQKRLGT